MDQDSEHRRPGTSSGSMGAAILVPFFTLILSGFAFYLYKHGYELTERAGARVSRRAARPPSHKHVNVA